MHDVFEYLPWLDTEIFRNTTFDYLLALAMFFGLWFAFVLIKRYVLKRVNFLLTQRNQRIRKVLDTLVDSIHPTVFPAIAFHIALQRLKVNDQIVKYTELLILAGVIIQCAYLLSKFAALMIIDLIPTRKGRVPDLSAASANRNLTAVFQAAIWVIAVLFYLSNLGVDITTFVTGLGIGGIAIALAAQNVLSDVFGSFVIALDKPFQVGDSVAIDNFSGTVEHVGLKTTRLRSSSGEGIILGNSDVTKSRIRNYKMLRERQVVFRFALPYQTSLESLKSVAPMIRSFIEGIEKTRFDRAHLLSFDEFGYSFEVCYFVNTSNYGEFCNIQERVNFQMIEAFAQRGMQFVLAKTLHVPGVSTLQP